MYYVYVIKSISRNYIYAGLSNNSDRRLKQHQNGENKTTRAYRPLILILSEKFPNREAARKREKFLKRGIGKEYLKNL
jgi:putative endonuclease